jgi:hypothetical protein
VVSAANPWVVHPRGRCLTSGLYHDEPFALWPQFKSKGSYNQERLTSLLQLVRDWNLFLAFNISDGCTEGKR